MVVMVVVVGEAAMRAATAARQCAVEVTAGDVAASRPPRIEESGGEAASVALAVLAIAASSAILGSHSIFGGEAASVALAVLAIANSEDVAYYEARRRCRS